MSPQIHVLPSTKQDGHTVGVAFWEWETSSTSHFPMHWNADKNRLALQKSQVGGCEVRGIRGSESCSWLYSS
jgi:hypothetical protein